MDKNDIIDYVMTTPHNTNKAVLSSMLNQLAEDGGGGSSDFSTAKLTVDVLDGVAIYGVSFVTSTTETMPEITPPIEFVMCDNLSNGDCDVVLYKGNALVFIDYDPSKVTGITAIGAIEKLNEDEEEGSISYKITGDCTITSDVE